MVFVLKLNSVLKSILVVRSDWDLIIYDSALNLCLRNEGLIVVERELHRLVQVRGLRDSKSIGI